MYKLRSLPDDYIAQRIMTENVGKVTDVEVDTFFYFEGLNQIVLELEAVFLQRSAQRDVKSLRQSSLESGHSMDKRDR